MSVFDKFLSAIKLNEDDLDDDEYFDEADEDDIDDNRPQRRIVSRDEEEDDLGLDAYERSRPASDVSASRTRRSRLGSSKVSAFRPRRESADSDSSGNFSVCVIKPRDMEDALEIAKMLIAISLEYFFIFALFIVVTFGTLKIPVLNLSPIGVSI